MNFMIVFGILVCSSFLISVYMFIVSKTLLISSTTVIVRTGGAMCCSVNGPVCIVCCVFDSVSELFRETIRNMFGCGCYFL